MKVQTIAGIVALATVVLVVLVSQGTHVTVVSSPAPVPSVAPTPLPTPVPTPDAFSAPRWMLANGTVMAWLLFLGLLPFFALLGIALHARHRSRLLELDHPPLRDREALHRTYDVKMLEARRGWLPEQFTYSPHMRNDAPLKEEEPPMELPGPALTAEQALDMPGIVYGQRLDTGEPLVEHRVLSLAIGGRPGSGKTSTVLLLAAQYARMGAELYVADPHAGHPDSLLTRLEPLTGRLNGERAETPREALHLIERVHEQLEHRKGGWRHHNGEHRPLVVVIDEFAESLRLLPPGDRERLLDRVQVIGYSGRKYGVAAILLAQSWLTSGVYTSQVRNPLQAAIVHAMRADEGRVMTGLRAEAWPSDPHDLPAGEAFVLGVAASGLIRVRVPLVSTRAHARGSASNTEPAPDWLQSGSAPVPLSPHDGVETEPDGTGPEPDGNRTGTASAQDWRIAELFDSGHDIAEIVRRVFDVTSRSGSRYQRASTEVQAALRRVRRQ